MSRPWHRDAGRRSAGPCPGIKGVPGKRALGRVAAIGISVRIEIRESMQFWAALVVVLIHMNRPFAELPRELHMLLGGQVLGWENQEPIAQPRLVDSPKNVVR